MELGGKAGKAGEAGHRKYGNLQVGVGNEHDAERGTNGEGPVGARRLSIMGLSPGLDPAR